LSRLTISFGVAAGASMPNQVMTSNPGKPHHRAFHTTFSSSA
jgi:hypothetical protein